MNLPASDINSLHKTMLSLKANDRVKLLTDLPNAMQVVRQIPAQDLFITLKEVGPSDALELLELVSPEQFQSFLDLDGWHHSHIDPITVGLWLSSMAEASLKKAVQIFSKLDIEFISMLLKMYTTIYDASAGEDPDDMGMAHSITPDRKYIIIFNASKDEESLVFFLKQAIEQLYQRDLSFIMSLIESTRWETPSTLEDEALRWRDGRMQDMGFAPLAEEKEILSFIDPDKLSPHSAATEDLPQQVPQNSLLLQETANHRLFQTALTNVSLEEQKRLYQELITVTNRVHVALDIDLGNVTALLDTANYTLNTVEIALAFLSKGDEHLLKKLLSSYTIKKLFQIGRSLALRIGRGFRKIISDSNSALSDEGLLRLDLPLAEVAGGILRYDPFYYSGLNDARKFDYRRFETLIDVVQTAKAISEATFRAYIIGPLGLGITEEKIDSLKLKVPNKLPTHGVYLATWLALQLLGNKPDIRSLTKAEL
ncbi:MAG: DUF6178 family protein, partial [bacterium]|nr:DUF6178 family protein [bacterium]